MPRRRRICAEVEAAVAARARRRAGARARAGAGRLPDRAQPPLEDELRADRQPRGEARPARDPHQQPCSGELAGGHANLRGRAEGRRSRAREQVSPELHRLPVRHARGRCVDRLQTCRPDRGTHQHERCRQRPDSRRAASGRHAQEHERHSRGQSWPLTGGERQSRRQPGDGDVPGPRADELHDPLHRGARPGRERRPRAARPLVLRHRAAVSSRDPAPPATRRAASHRSRPPRRAPRPSGSRRASRGTPLCAAPEWARCRRAGRVARAWPRRGSAWRLPRPAWSRSRRRRARAARPHRSHGTHLRHHDLLTVHHVRGQVHRGELGARPGPAGALQRTGNAGARVDPVQPWAPHLARDVHVYGLLAGAATT